MLRSSTLLLLSACVIMAAGCKSSDAPKETAEMDSSPRYVQLASDRFGENAEFIENASGQYVLVVSKGEWTQSDPTPPVSFFVFGKEDDEITYESEIVGSVTWLDEFHLEVIILPRVVKADSEAGGITYRVDARTGSRVELTTPGRR